MIPWWDAFRQGRLGHFSSRSTAAEIHAVMGPSDDHTPPRSGSVIYKWGALQVDFHEGELMFLLIEFTGDPIPPALGLDVGELRRGTTIEAFRATAEARGVDLHDVTPDALADDHATWLAGAGGVYAAFHVEDGLYALGLSCY